MQLTKEELSELRSLRENPDDINIRYKQIIKHKLLDNNKIIYLLHNKELEDAECEADEYFGVNILPEYVVPGTQHNVQNFVCFETSTDKVSRDNAAMAIQKIVFYVLCHNDTNIVEEIGSSRHDLIAALIKRDFQGSNDFGSQLKLTSDVGGITDTNYASRTLVFEQITPNNLIKDGKTIGLRRGGY